MVRNILSIVAGYLIWTAIFLGGAAVIRRVKPAVHDAEGMTQDTATLAIYLAISMLASLVAGFFVARIAAKSKMRCVFLVVVALLATGVPVQLSAWEKLPVWYNLIFLAMLVPLPLLGGAIALRSQPDHPPSVGSY